MSSREGVLRRWLEKGGGQRRTIRNTPQMMQNSQSPQPARERGRLYDRMDQSLPYLLYRVISRFTASSRERTVAQLDLTSGEAVLDLGCGPGVNFEMLREIVGPTGAVVGLDYSTEMIQRAAQRIHEHQWPNVHVVRGDATHPCFGSDVFDAAVATLAVSTMPDVRNAIEGVYDALRPGGRFVVLDGRPIQSGPARLVNSIMTRLYTYFVDWKPEEDVLAELQTVFDTISVRTFYAGSRYIALAGKTTK